MQEKQLITKVNKFSNEHSDKEKDKSKGFLIKYIIEDLGGRVFIFPALQMNLINIREDENLFQSMLEYITQRSDAKLDFCTGYLNIMPSYLKHIQNSKSEVNMLTASPEANGFYKAGMIKKWIPYLYREYEKKLLKKSKNN